MKEFTRSSFSFRRQTIDLSEFTGEGNDDVQIRFTVSTDDEGVTAGVWIDDISFKVSEQALAISRERLGKVADRVRWLIGAITEVRLPGQGFALWHDRAVFHFMVGA